MILARAESADFPDVFDDLEICSLGTFEVVADVEVGEVFFEVFI